MMIIHHHLPPLVGATVACVFIILFAGAILAAVWPRRKK